MIDVLAAAVSGHRRPGLTVALVTAFLCCPALAGCGESAAPRAPQPESGSKSTRHKTSRGVVVSRPAVIVGAPPTVVGGKSGPTRRPPRARKAKPDEKPESLFGQGLISEKSLDEVILAYLSDDSGEE